MKKTSSDWLIALGVIACSIVLLAALSFALMGNPFSRPTRTLRVEFPDITGLQPRSLVKLAGAAAGTIHTIRILTPEERLASTNPANTVELTLAINDQVPPMNVGLIATVSADTLLADKFVHLAPGDPAAPILENNALIPGVAPTTIDALVRTLDHSLTGLNSLLANSNTEAPGLLDGLNSLLIETQSTLAQVNTLIARAGGTFDGADALVAQARGTLTGADSLVANAQALVTDANALVSGDSNSLRTLITDLTATADQLDALVARTDKLIAANADTVTASLREARVAVQNLKVSSTYLKALALTLSRRPQQLIWGPRGSPIEVPPESLILKTPKPFPIE